MISSLFVQMDSTRVLTAKGYFNLNGMQVNKILRLWSCGIFSREDTLCDLLKRKAHLATGALFC